MTEEQSGDVEEATFAGPRQEAPFLQSLFCPCDRDYAESDEEKEQINKHLAEVIEKHHEQPGVLWFSFFSDLIYVCVIVKFTEQYKHFVEEEEIHPETHAWHWFEFRLTLELMLYFLAFFTIWIELVQIKARFYDLPGVWDDIIQYLFLIGIVFMAIEMDANSYLLDNKAGFVVGFGICTLSMFILHLLYYGAIEDSRNYVLRRLVGYGTVVPLVGGLIAVDELMDLDQDTSEILTVSVVVLCCLILLSVAFVSFRVMKEYNYTEEFFAMRFGILTMIIIGESMLACIVGDKTFGYLAASEGGGALQATHAASYAYSAAATVAKTVLTSKNKDVTLAPDAEITEGNVLQFLKKYGSSEAALGALSGVAQAVGDAAHASSAAGSYALNHNGYYIYDQTGAFFQHGETSYIEDYVGIFLAFGTLYILKNIYFGSHGEVAEEALDNEDSPGSVWWIAVHVPMYFTLLTTGAGFRLMFTVIHDKEVYQGYVALLVMSVSLAITFMIMLRLARPPKKGIMSFQELVLRLATVFVLSSLVMVFLDEPIPLLCCTFIITCLSWVYDLIFPPHGSQSAMRVGSSEDEYSVESQNQSEKYCWGSFLKICGLGEACGYEEDHEYKRNFTGPKEEGSVLDLLEDVICCQLCENPAPVPDYFSPEYEQEIRRKQHHDESHHEAHSHENQAEVGADHGMFGEFTDLIYVAIVIKFADQMKYKQFTPYQADDELVEDNDARFRIYFEAAVFFMCFFYTWLELTHCLLRFKNMPGIFDDIMLFFYLSGVVGMAVNLNHLEYLTERRMAFCMWFSFSMASLTILHIFYSQINDAEEYVRRRLPWFTLSAIVAFAAGFLQPEYCLVALLFAVGLPMLISTNSYRVWSGQEFSKHDQMHYIERFGLLIMICIGESVLALVLFDFEREYEFYLVIFVAFTTMYMILQSYVKSDTHVKAHALAEGEICGSITWVCMHGLAAYCLLGMGVGYKMILPYANYHSIGEVERYTLCYSLFGVLMCFMMIRASHNLFQLTVTSFTVRVVVAGSAIVAGHFLENPIYVVCVCMSVAVFSFILDFLFIDALLWEVDRNVYEKIHGKRPQGRCDITTGGRRDTQSEYLLKNQKTSDSYTSNTISASGSGS